jgi:hypothetical protein
VLTSNPKCARFRVDLEPVVDKGGKFAFAGWPSMNFLLQHPCAPLPSAPGSPKPSVSYQPASWFWPFQWIEGGWLLALSMLLIAATVWLVRHRAA